MTSPFDFIPQVEQAAILAGTSTYDCTNDLRTMYAKQGARSFDWPGGTFSITGSVQIPSGTVSRGNKSTIKCPDVGWPIGQSSTYGLFNLIDADDVSISGFRFCGTKNADNGHTPKLIGFFNSTNVELHGNVFENSAFEGIYPCSGSFCRITGNYFRNVGYPAGEFNALPAIQANISDSIIGGNLFSDVGIGVGGSSAGLLILNNRIHGVHHSGIGIGDAPSQPGIVVRGNSIEFDSDAALVRYGIELDAWNDSVLVDNNDIKINTTGGHEEVMGIRATAIVRPIITDNIIQVTGNLAKVELFYAEAPASGVQDVTFRDNILIMNGLGYGVECVPGGNGRTQNLLIAGNRVIGAGNATAYYAYAGGGGTLKAVLSNNFKDGGWVYVGDNVTRRPGDDNDLAYSYTNRR